MLDEFNTNKQAKDMNREAPTEKKKSKDHYIFYHHSFRESRMKEQCLNLLSKIRKEKEGKAYIQDSINYNERKTPMKEFINQEI